MKTNTIIQGDCIEELKKLPDNSIDAIVTDPPYGIGFMGKEWDKFEPKTIKEETDKSKLDYLNSNKVNSDNPNLKGRKLSPIGSASSVAGSYDLSFEGKGGYQKWCYEWSKECLRVLKAGGFLLASNSTRMYHRMACGIEDAGFEIRDCIMWLYGSGFPKSLNIGKQIDKMNGKYDNDFTKFGDYVRECREKKGLSRNEVEKELGTNTALAWWEGRNYLGKFTVQLPDKKHYQELKKLLDMDDRFDELVNWAEAEREVTGKDGRGEIKKDMFFHKGGEVDKAIGYGKWDLKDKPATPEAKEWEGWGTALKPAVEPIVVARKPLSEKNVALNVLKHKTGGINIDGCRIEHNDKVARMNVPYEMKADNNFGGGHDYRTGKVTCSQKENQGRFPANIILDEESAEMFPDDIEEYDNYGQQTLTGDILTQENKSASRFFYVAKASKSERNFGCEEMEEKTTDDGREVVSDRPHQRGASQRKNNHPTVKPIKLMEYLVKLVSREGAIILDPFGGSGTSAIACLKQRREFILIEKEKEYVKIAEARIKPYLEQKKLM